MTFYDKATFAANTAANVPALRIQNGSAYYSVEVGADYTATTVTANTTKMFTMAGLPYAGTTYNAGFLEQLGDVSGSTSGLEQSVGHMSELPSVLHGTQSNIGSHIEMEHWS